MIYTSGDVSRQEASRRVRSGAWQRLADGLYSDDVRSTPEQIIARDWMRVLAKTMPGAVITYRSAFAMRPEGGELHVSHPRQAPLSLPGLTIRPDGIGRHDLDDIPVGGVFLASQARALVDNSPDHRGRPLTRVSRLTREELHDQIVRLAQTTDATRVQALVADVKARAATPAVGDGIDVFFRAARADISTVESQSRAMRFAQRGEGYDGVRVERFRDYALALMSKPPVARVVAVPRLAKELPFYEAYFSNYIEGTDFTLAEAERVVYEGVDLGRPADAHDVLGTWKAVTADDMHLEPRDADDFLDSLRTRHALIMGGRPDKLPGRFKVENNRAGATEFVDKHLVVGTLRAGWEEGERLSDPFQRANYLMFLVSEVHPFTDGNGRSARIAMNNALVAAQQYRVVIPTILRGDYLSALTRATADGGPDGLWRILDHAQHWASRGDFSTLISGERYLDATNAQMNDREAERTRTYLEVPAFSPIRELPAEP